VTSRPCSRAETRARSLSATSSFELPLGAGHCAARE
jgi:hypothetical protein